MKRSRVVLLIGMLLYVASFFLVAIQRYDHYGRKGQFSSDRLTGASCAYLTLYWPMENLYDSMTGKTPNPVHWTAFISPFFISGCINPIFLISMIALVRNPSGKPGAILRIALLLMFVAPLIYFYQSGDTRPTTGYFLWMAGMLLALFSDKTLLWRTRARAQE